MKKTVLAVLSTTIMLSAIGNISLNVNAEDADFIEYGVSEECDFENYDVADFTTTGKYLDSKLWIYSIANGDSVSIVQDSENNKALKITRKVANIKSSSTKVNFVFNEAYTGKIKINFDVKIGNDNGGCSSFCGFGSSSSTGISPGVNNRLDHGYWWAKNSGTEQWTNSNSWGSTWFPAEMTIDVANGAYSGFTYRYYGKNDQRKIEKTWNFDNVDVSDIKYMCLASIGSANTNSTVTADTEYYFDNIRVTKYDYPQMKVEGTSITEDKMGVNTPIKIRFNEAVSQDSLNTDDFVVTKSGNVFVDYSVSSDTTGKVITLTPNNGWDYNSTYDVVVKKSIKPSRGKVIGIDEDYTDTFLTESIMGSINIKNNSRYNLSVTPLHDELSGISYNTLIKYEDGQYEEYDYAELNNVGRYNLKIIAELNNKQEILELQFYIIGEIPPTATDITIDGQMKLGETIEGSYRFKDENGDEEDISEYRWLVSDKIDGIYTPISGQNNKTITVNEDFIDKYICFEVTPVSKREPQKGEKVVSTPIKGIFKPIVKEIKIIQNQNKIESEYTYFDENKDEEGLTKFQWYRSSKKDGEYTKIKDATGNSYELTEHDNNSFIKLEIIPMSSEEPFSGDAVTSDAFTAPFAPTAKDLKFIGTAKAGNSIGAEYKYYDENGDIEGKSIISWYVDNSFVKNGPSLNLTSKDAGKSVYFKITPVSVNMPYEGIAVTSDSITVSKSGTITSSGGGGASIITPTQKPQENKDNNETEGKNSDNNQEFKDIESHWAKDYIISMFEKGIINGIKDDEFKPDDTVSRAQIAAILCRAFNLKGIKVDFTDVKESDWYYESVGACADNGIFIGENGLFRPNDKITREELCVVLERIAQKYNIDTEVKEINFSDIDTVSNWALEQIKKVYLMGIINGMNDGTFSPKKSTTRAQAVVMIYRLLDKIGGWDNE